MNRKKPKLSFASTKSSGLGLLGSYINISSDESEEEAPAQKDERSVTSLVDDFVKEVNGMDTKSKSSKKPSKKETTPQAAAVPAEEINWGPWKKCIDAKTNYPYYWNTETNDVRWDLPAELMVATSSIKKPTENDNKEKSSRKETLNETESAEPISKKQKLSKIVKEKVRSTTDSGVVAGRSVFAARKVEDVSDKVASSSTSQDKKYQQKKDEFLLLSKPKSKSLTSSESLGSRYESDKSRSKWRSTDEKMSSSLTHQSSSRSLDRKKSREKVDFPTTKISNSLHDEIMSNSHKKSSKSSSSSSSSSHPVVVGGGTDGSRLGGAEGSDSSSRRSSRSPENTELKETIRSTSKVLLDKLKYLEVHILSQYHILAIEIRTRADDWKAGELSDAYVIKKFQQAESKLKEYEKTAVPRGWSCDWNSQYSRYYYRNDITGETQWNYPQEIASAAAVTVAAASTVATAASTVTAAVPVHTVAPTVTVAPQATTTTGINVDGLQALSSSVTKESPMPPPTPTATTGVQLNIETATTTTTAVGGIMTTASSTVTQPSTTDSTPAYNQYQQHYWMYNMAYPYNGSSAAYPAATDSIPPPPGEETSAAPQPPLPPSDLPFPPLPPPPPLDNPAPPPLPPSEPKEAGGMIVDEEMEICSDLETDEGSRSIIIVSDDSDSTLLASSSISAKPKPAAEIASGPVDYSSVPVRFPMVFPSAVTTFQSAAVLPTATTIQQQHNNDSDGTNNNNQKPATTTADKTKKMKKVKKVAKKPPKQVSGMISKWQKAQSEMDDEEKTLLREAEEALEEETDVNKRIEKWKKKQLESGKAVGNSNFEPVGDSWKQRVKKRV